MTSSKPQFQWDDPFFLEAQLNDEERMVRDAAKAFADDILMPRVIGGDLLIGIPLLNGGIEPTI